MKVGGVGRAKLLNSPTPACEQLTDKTYSRHFNVFKNQPEKNYFVFFSNDKIDHDVT